VSQISQENETGFNIVTKKQK